MSFHQYITSLVVTLFLYLFFLFLSFLFQDKMLTEGYISKLQKNTFISYLRIVTDCCSSVGLDRVNSFNLNKYFAVLEISVISFVGSKL